MSADTLAPDGPFCCVCGDPADARIEWDDDTLRTVCEDHIDGHEVDHYV